MSTTAAPEPLATTNPLAPALAAAERVKATLERAIHERDELRAYTTLLRRENDDLRASRGVDDDALRTQAQALTDQLLALVEGEPIDAATLSAQIEASVRATPDATAVAALPAPGFVTIDR